MKLKTFCEDLSQSLKKFENVRVIFVPGDVNTKLGSTEIRGSVGKCGVYGVNKNGHLC